MSSGEHLENIDCRNSWEWGEKRQKVDNSEHKSKVGKSVGEGGSQTFSFSPQTHTDMPSLQTERQLKWQSIAVMWHSWKVC